MMPLVRPRTDAEIEKLKVLAGSGASPIKCAAALKRIVEAVRRQAIRWGFTIAGIRETRKRQRAPEAEAIRQWSGEVMWRRIGEWIGPEAPREKQEDSGLVLGVLAILILTMSLPYLFGFH